MLIGSQKILLGVLAFLGLVLCLYLPLRAAEPPAPPPITIAPEKQGEMQEIRLTEIQGGEKKWVLTAANADYLEG